MAKDTQDHAASHRQGDYVIADRGGVIENRHLVHVAVIDNNGNSNISSNGSFLPRTARLIREVGDPHRLTLIRSAFKPVQTLAILETGAASLYGFTTADIALMCASHSSEPAAHVARARSMLAKAGCTADQLQCGPHEAVDPEITKQWLRTGYAPTGIDNNCSGKHAGMLAAAKAMDAGTEGYHEMGHPLQERVRRAFEEVCGLRGEEVPWTVDGCNLPAPGVPLDVLAEMFAKFADAGEAFEALGGARVGPEEPAGKLTTADDAGQRRRLMAEIFNAMAHHGHLVGGSGRFCTQLMDAFGGALIDKVGADGCYGIGIRPCEDTRRLGAAGSLGIAVKIEDGNLDILYSAVAEVLEQLDIGTEEQRARFGGYHRPERRNTMGAVVGGTTAVFGLRQPARSSGVGVKP